MIIGNFWFCSVDNLFKYIFRFVFLMKVMIGVFLLISWCFMVKGIV